MHFESIIFDLDGTLVNSLPGIEASAQYAVEQCLPERKLPALRELIGPPIATMLAMLWPDLDQERLNAVVIAFRKHYDVQGCLLSELYPGVAETLEHLHRCGLRLFVLTHKPRSPTISILKRTGVLPLFTEVTSPDPANSPIQSKTDGAALLGERFRLEPGRTALVGDGKDDARTAGACGFAFIAVDYGYGGVSADLGLAKLAVLKKFSEIEHIVLT